MQTLTPVRHFAFAMAIAALFSCSSSTKPDRCISDALVFSDREKLQLALKALKNWDSKAAIELGNHYDVIAMDSISAAAWYKIAASLGDDVGKHNLKLTLQHLETKLNFLLKEKTGGSTR